MVCVCMMFYGILSGRHHLAFSAWADVVPFERMLRSSYFVLLGWNMHIRRLCELVVFALLHQWDIRSTCSCNPWFPFRTSDFELEVAVAGHHKLAVEQCILIFCMFLFLGGTFWKGSMCCATFSVICILYPGMSSHCLARRCTCSRWVWSSINVFHIVFLYMFGTLLSGFSGSLLTTPVCCWACEDCCWWASGIGYGEMKES